MATTELEYTNIESDINAMALFAKASYCKVRRLGLTAFSKIFDFVKNVWFPITQQKKYDNNEKCFNKIKKGNIN